MIYLDNAATTFPKPVQTVQRLNEFVLNCGGNPGRSGHTLSVDAARVIFETREKLTSLIGGSDSERLIFTQNGTESLNLAIFGLVREGGHVITTSLEHNSVMRPLTYLQRTRAVRLSMARCSSDGIIDLEHLEKLVREHPSSVVIINHGSNVIGTIQPVHAIRQIIGDNVLIVDACQTVGATAIRVDQDGIDALCFSCHKSLYGIQGSGAIYMRDGVDPAPLRFGGTGSKSESIEQPAVLPDKYESGTPNTPGIASLLGGLSFIEKTGLEHIARKEQQLRMRIVKGLRAIHGVKIYGTMDPAENTIPVVSFNIKDKMPSEVGYILNREQIYTRVGLHCSPVAHKTIGTFPGGTVRVAPGFFTSETEIEVFLKAVTDIANT